MVEATNKAAYHFHESVELLGALLPAPPLEVEHVDAVGPGAGAVAEALLHDGLREVEVLAVPPEASEAGVQRGVHVGAHVDAPQPRQVPLHHHVVLQEHHPPQRREHLREVEPEVVQQRHVPVPVLDLPEDRRVGRVQEREVGDGQELHVRAQRRRAAREPDAEGREVHGRRDHVEDVARGLGGRARRGGHHDGDGEHVVGEDGVVVERRVGELRRRDGGLVGDRGGVGEAGLEEAHGEAVERLGRGPRGDAGVEHARAAGAEELLPHGEDGVGELLDLGLRVERLLGAAGEGARALHLGLDLLLQRPHGGEREAGGERGEARGDGEEGVRLGGRRRAEVARVRRVGCQDGGVVLGVALDDGQAQGRGVRGGRSRARGSGGQEERHGGEEDQGDDGRERRATTCRGPGAGHGERVVRVREGRDEEMARNAFQAGGFGLVAPWPIRCGLLEVGFLRHVRLARTCWPRSTWS